MKLNRQLKRNCEFDFVITSDLHLHEHPLFVDVRKGNENIFVDTAFSCLGQIEMYMRKNSIKHFFFLGDLFHNRRPPINLIYNLQLRFNNWSKGGIHIYLLRGNPTHEGVGQDYVGNLFRVIPNIHVFGFDEFWHLPHTMDNKYEFVMIPYGTKTEIQQALKDYHSNRSHLKHIKRIGMFHYGLKGAKIQDYEYQKEDSLDAVDLSDFDYVFAGHFHKYQQVFKNCFQVGSPYRVSFAEKDDDKGFIHFTEDGPKFVKLDAPGMLEISVSAGYSPEKCKGNFVKVYGSEIEFRGFDFEDSKRNLIKAGALGVKFETIPDNKTEEKEVRISKELSPGHMLNEYLDSQKEEIDEKKLSVKKLKRLSGEALV